MRGSKDSKRSRGSSAPERTRIRRRRVLLGVWLAATAALVARAAQVQVAEAELWREAAERQHRTSREVAAPRGAILDRRGEPLALSREVVSVAIAPGEIRDTARVRSLLVRALGLTPAEALRHTDASRSWRVIPGRYDPSVLEALSGVRGIHIERTHQRFYPRGELARGVLGAVIDGVGTGGIEEVYEALLSGRPGRQVAARDPQGREVPGETFVVAPPVPGGDVRLTIDLNLQEIAHEALSAALASTGARGGDLVVTDPRSGEILALVSVQDGRSDALSAVNAPYEPGSTLKTFTVAALLQQGAGRLTDSIDTHGGAYRTAGREITDVRDYGALTLGDALRVSSNVAMARAAEALLPGEHYQALRDFGFGVKTGVALPGEVPGELRRPSGWSAQSSASLAIGYEISVTPLQMALAYGALANGGVLMEPRLVREVRGPDGTVTEEPPPRALRQVVAPAVAGELGRVLVEVVEGGTGTAARIETFQVAGKTGTSRAYEPGVGYAGGRYYSSFAAFFPADDPQLVVFVKLDSPRGAYYGGATAAPVTRATMEAALAARQTPLDRRALLQATRSRGGVTQPSLGEAAGGAASEAGAVRFAATALPAAPPSPAPRSPVPPAFASTAFAGGAPSAPSAQRLFGPALDADGTLAVPDVGGLAPRVAARRLHAAGLRVAWDGGARVLGTEPPPGSRVAPGATVTLRTQARPGP